MGRASTRQGYGRFAVVRYRTDGALDRRFGDDGIVTTDLTAREDAATGVAIQPDGKIVVVGTATGAHWWSRFAVVRYERNGALDGTFGRRRLRDRSLRGGGDDVASDVAIGPDGKIVVVGTTSSLQRSPSLGSTAPAGSIRPSTVTGGHVRARRRVRLRLAVALQPDGRIVGRAVVDRVGVRRDRRPPDEPEGTLDEAFGIDGVATAEFTAATDGGGTERDVALQPDGKIMVAGDAGGPAEYTSRSASHGSAMTACSTRRSAATTRSDELHEVGRQRRETSRSSPTRRSWSSVWRGSMGSSRPSRSQVRGRRVARRRVRRRWSCARFGGAGREPDRHPGRARRGGRAAARRPDRRRSSRWIEPSVDRLDDRFSVASLPRLRAVAGVGGAGRRPSAAPHGCSDVVLAPSFATSRATPRSGGATSASSSACRSCIALVVTLLLRAWVRRSDRRAKDTADDSLEGLHRRRIATHRRPGVGDPAGHRLDPDRLLRARRVRRAARSAARERRRRRGRARLRRPERS